MSCGPTIILSDEDIAQLIGWIMVALFVVGVAVGFAGHAAFVAIGSAKRPCESAESA